jgi:hypothetical protein
VHWQPTQSDGAHGCCAYWLRGNYLAGVLYPSYTWLREGRANNAEVDFVLSFDGQIVPIEIKSGATGSLKSLHQFVGEKNVPLYLVERLPELQLSGNN